MKNLSEKDLEWIAVYDLGDSTLFVSNHANTDTMIITKKYNTNRTNPFYFNEADDDTYEANAGYDYIIKQSNIWITGDLLIGAKYGSDSLETIYSLKMRYSKRNIAKLDGDILRPLQLRKFEYNGQIYDNCIIADSTNSGYSTYRADVVNKVEKFVWSKEYGLIYYKFEDGEEFFREDLQPDSINL